MFNLISKFKKALIAIIFIAIIATLLFSIKTIQLHYSDFSRTTPSGSTISTQFPFYISSEGTGIYKLTGKIYKNEFASTKIRIIPDDALHSMSINNRVVDLSGIPYEQLSDYRHGFIIDLNDYLNNGTNNIAIVYSDTGGMMGITFQSLHAENLNKSLLIVIGIFISFLIFQYTTLIRSLKILFVCALFIRLFYFDITSFDTRGHDTWEHLEFIEYLTSHALPPSLEHATGGAFFHPPLYYYAGAAVYKTAELYDTNKEVIYRTLQFLSFSFSMGFVFFGLLILNNLININENQVLPTKKFSPFRANIRLQNGINIETPNTRYMNKFLQRALKSETKDANNENRQNFIARHRVFVVIGAMFAFWPVSIIHSPRIGNDTMLYFLFSASIYYILKWHQNNKKSDLLIASFISAAAILTKANGEILIGVIAILGLYKMIKSQEWKKYFSLATIPCLVLFLALSITILPGLLLKLQGKREQLYIDNIENVSAGLRVGNAASNFLWFDAKTFITEPFTSPWDDKMGRQYFGNYLGKTGLFGEFSFSSQLAKNTATISSFILIWMTLYLLIGLYHLRKEDYGREAVTLISGVLLLGAITYVRITFPVNIDFRYIVPALISFCSLYAASIFALQRIGATRLANIGLALSALFSFSNILFVFGIS